MTITEFPRSTSSWMTTQQHQDVLEVEAGRRLVEDVERPAGGPLGELGGEFDPLRLAARKRGGRLPEVDIARAPPAKGPTSFALMAGSLSKNRSASSTVMSSTSAMFFPL